MTEQELQSIKNRYGIIGNTGALNFALLTAAQVANTDLTVLIQGESGVGKEVFSQIIHNLSSRKHNSFIAINCGAIPEGTIDSELFGHEKGAYTSAVDSRKGYFETVNGGTIFLDEIGEMPLGTQARLLRVLETGEYIRVGSSKVQKTNVRVIAATNRNLLTEVQSGKFREDLYYRLSTVPIKVPSLRERKEDAYLLFKKFCVDFAEKYRTQPVQLNEEARQVLLGYHWPGNIRELKNIAEQVSVLSENKSIGAEVLMRFLPQAGLDQSPVLVRNNEGSADFANERDILYKLFFDMKKDVTELKRMFYDMANFQGIAPGTVNPDVAATQEFINNYRFSENSAAQNVPMNTNFGFVQNTPSAEVKIDHTSHVEVEESLSIANMEKELIIRALKKHKLKRRDAALELGISERTLYRKIKEYDVE
jgi:transcriptional regulator with GAF, ATPase, and Fis domain